MSTTLTIPDGHTVTITPVPQAGDRMPPSERYGTIQASQMRCLHAVSGAIFGGIDDEDRGNLSELWVGVRSWKALSEAQASTMIQGLIAVERVSA